MILPARGLRSSVTAGAAKSTDRPVVPTPRMFFSSTCLMYMRTLSCPPRRLGAVLDTVKQMPHRRLPCSARWSRPLAPSLSVAADNATSAQNLAFAPAAKGRCTQNLANGHGGRLIRRAPWFVRLAKPRNEKRLAGSKWSRYDVRYGCFSACQSPNTTNCVRL